MMESPGPRSRAAAEGPTASESENNSRREAIRRDIAHRLRRSCSHLSEDAFAALVDKIMRVQIAGEARSQ
jgi:hypothetical protein